MIGDAAMFVSRDAEPLVDAALSLLALADEQGESMPRVRIGVASGPAIPQSGDWYGAPVNLASRVTRVARPASVLATQSVRDAVGPAFSWSFAGHHRFKGVRGDVSLFRVRREPRSAAG
jgi:adenylate cyclase